MKAKKGMVLGIAPYRTVTIEVSDMDNFEACDKELKKELNRMPEIKKLNAADIKKVLP
jgi:hypothetical protein